MAMMIMGLLVRGKLGKPRQANVRELWLAVQGKMGGRLWSPRGSEFRLLRIFCCNPFVFQWDEISPWGPIQLVTATARVICHLPAMLTCSSLHPSLCLFPDILDTARLSICREAGREELSRALE